MATSMTFTTLQNDLRAYLERGYPQDTTVFAQLPRIINLAERAIARALKIQGFITVVNTTLKAGVCVYAKPDRWRRTVSMAYGAAIAVSFITDELGEILTTEQDASLILETGDSPQNVGTPIFGRALEYCTTYWPDQTQQNPPEFYADYDYTHWLVIPPPDVSYPWRIVYYELPALLDSTNQTNWLTNYAPNALLYRALLECTPFLKNDERIPVWKQFYDEEMAALNSEDMQRVVDRASVRNED